MFKKGDKVYGWSINEDVPLMKTGDMVVGNVLYVNDNTVTIKSVISEREVECSIHEVNYVGTGPINDYFNEGYHDE